VSDEFGFFLLLMSNGLLIGLMYALIALGFVLVLYTYFLGIANYEQFQIGVSIDYLAMIIIGGSARSSAPSSEPSSSLCCPS